MTPTQVRETTGGSEDLPRLKMLAAAIRAEKGDVMTIGPGLAFRGHARFVSEIFRSNANQGTICNYAWSNASFDSTSTCSCPRHLRLRSGSLARNEVPDPPPVQFVFEKLIESFIVVTFKTFVTSNALYCQKDWRILVVEFHFLRLSRLRPPSPSSFQFRI